MKGQGKQRKRKRKSAQVPPNSKAQTAQTEYTWRYTKMEIIFLLGFFAIFGLWFMGSIVGGGGRGAY